MRENVIPSRGNRGAVRTRNRYRTSAIVRANTMSASPVAVFQKPKELRLLPSRGDEAKSPTKHCSTVTSVFPCACRLCQFGYLDTHLLDRVLHLVSRSACHRQTRGSKLLPGMTVSIIPLTSDDKVSHGLDVVMKPKRCPAWASLTKEIKTPLFCVWAYCHQIPRYRSWITASNMFHLSHGGDPS